MLVSVPEELNRYVFFLFELVVSNILVNFHSLVKSTLMDR